MEERSSLSMSGENPLVVVVPMSVWAMVSVSPLERAVRFPKESTLQIDISG